MYNSAVKLLDEIQKYHSDKIGLEDEKQSFSFGELKKLSMSIGTDILNKLLPNNKKTQIAVYMQKSCQNIVSFMGILYSGHSYVPLDTNMPKNRLEKILSNLEPIFIITDTKNAIFLQNELNIPSSKILIYDDIVKTTPDQTKIDSALEKVIDTDPIYIMYTSGSTGNPKGVVIPHRGVIDYANWVTETFEIDCNEIIGNQAPFHFDNSVLDIYSTLKSGAKLIIIPEVFFQFPSKLPEYISQNNITTIFFVPTVLINIANSGFLEKIKMPLLKKVLFCGEVMPNKQLNIWRKNHTDAIYANLYGPTEITDVCTYFFVNQTFLDNEPLPIGIPCKNTNAIILNSENNEADFNEIGELCILGSGLALGYFKEPEITKKAFMQNPLNTLYSEIIYRTGDLVFKDSTNNFIYVGRKDSQIKHKGNRIELGEIETIAKSIKEIENACVLYDEINQEIVLFAQLSEDKKERTLIMEMRKLLPSYMLPTKIVKLTNIPLNANGKIDRVSLKKTFKKEV